MWSYHQTFLFSPHHEITMINIWIEYSLNPMHAILRENMPTIRSLARMLMQRYTRHFASLSAWVTVQSMLLICPPYNVHAWMTAKIKQNKKTLFYIKTETPGVKIALCFDYQPLKIQNQVLLYTYIVKYMKYRQQFYSLTHLSGQSCQFCIRAGRNNHVQTHARKMGVFHWFVHADRRLKDQSHYGKDSCVTVRNWISQLA